MAVRLKSKPLAKHIDRTTAAYGGPMTVDVTAIKALLIVLAKGARKGLRTPHVGIDEVVAELAVAVPANGAAAGIAPALYTALTTNTGNINALTPLLQAATLIVASLTDSLAMADDLREQQLSQIADAIQSTATRMKNEGIKTPFKKTLAYKNQAAEKGVRTRKLKKANASPAPATTPAAPAPAPAATPTAGH